MPIICGLFWMHDVVICIFIFISAILFAVEKEMKTMQIDMKLSYS